MPISVLLIGMLSIILLLWVDQINKKLLQDAELLNAIMDVEIHTGTAHLWLEEALTGNVPLALSDTFVSLDQAVKLVDTNLRGGQAENDLILEQLTDPELKDRAEAIRSLLLKLRGLGLERWRQSDKSGSGSVLEQEFHAVFKEALGKARDLKDIIKTYEAENRKKSGRLFLSILTVWAFIVIFATAGLWNLEKRRNSSEEKLLLANEKLLAQAKELTTHREHLAEQVESRTAELRAANKLLQDEVAVRRLAEEALKNTEKQVRQLSSQCLAAQEVERGRISRELHDGLGQSLNVIKLRTRFIEQGLSGDQGDIRKDCEELLEYTNQVIEDVRRLSRDLSPTILADLGLTSAIRWLLNDFAKNQGVGTKLDIAEIDDLFDENSRIMIFRIVQELLTNIGKHSQAGNVSLVVRRERAGVIFQLEDDGRGFNPEEAGINNGGERGLGLASVNERVRMLGGLLDLQSGEGKGTRISFSLPIGKREV
jgi:signal transduction histidine kinase